MKKCRFLSLLMATVMAFSCAEKDDIDKVNEGDNGLVDEVLILSYNKDVIKSDGNDAVTLTVFLGEQDVTSESIIYDEEGNQITGDGDVWVLDGNSLTAKSEGEIKLWASYKALITAENEYVKIRAIDADIPSLAEDTDSDNTSFVHRSFLTQYTAKNCGYCPGLTYTLKQVFKEEAYADKAVWAAVHSGVFSVGDPARIEAPIGDDYPSLLIDMNQLFFFELGDVYFKGILDRNTAEPAKVGISVNPLLDGEELILKVGVKAAETGKYYVGAWLLEDDIYAVQSIANEVKYYIEKDEDGTYKSFNTHNNCVRIADSSFAGGFSGHPLGTIVKGSVSEKTFFMELELGDDKLDWKLENLHLAVFVTTKDEDGHYYVLNAIDCPIDVPTSFEYK